MIFDWDDGNSAKCAKHGLTRDDIEFALQNGARVAPDVKHSVAETRFIAVSRAPNSRPVFIAFCWRGDAVRPISARYMHAKEARRYDQTRPETDDG